MGAMVFTRGTGVGGTFDPADTFEDTYKRYRVVRGNLTWSASYATGGDTIPMTAVGLDEVFRVLVDPAAGGLQALGGYNPRLVGTSKAPKLELWINAAEAANASNQTTKGVAVWLLGI